ncbi:PREDICTED: membrane protein of ER body 1-like isoform X2 [Lupinus angustifolius]|uniref:membrane protein of ER body 1-like isoform X2 n=1 Tax=Lupinus angustifolius TaxID=3871 RepID=UPI00092EFD95|nr:PREDICTED: membrane protein of ER body 1-like isoform X2 [Lupinus angustifolius]
MEIVKSIVYGGLTESLASLTVFTSAASADATILSIVALVLANLISGLFIFVHDLGELKGEEPKRAENKKEASVDRYNELLGQRKNLYLHAFITIISFIVFGLVPPAVYGFSFHENGDKDFKKLIAVVVASLLCITLLSIAKAYTQKSNTFVAYFKTVIYYVSSGAVCLVLSYLAGDLVKKLLEKVSWLEPSSNFGLHVQGMSVQKTEWSSY